MAGFGPIWIIRTTQFQLPVLFSHHLSISKQLSHRFLETGRERQYFPIARNPLRETLTSPNIRQCVILVLDFGETVNIQGATDNGF